MKPKKQVSILLCLALILSFTACGVASESTSAANTSAEAAAPAAAESSTQDDGATATAEGPADPAAASAESAADDAAGESASVEPFQLPICEETATISFWFEESPMVANYINDMNDNITYQLLEELTNVHLDFNAVTDETDQQFNLMVASGDYADIMMNANRYYAGGVIKGVDDEVFMELTDVIEDYMPNYARVVADHNVLSQVSLSDGRIGQIYAINHNPSVPGTGPIIRKDWLDDLGIAPEDIVTYDDYYNVLTAFKNEKGATGALYLSPTGVPQGNYLVAGYGIAAYCDSTSDSGAFYQNDGVVEFGPIQDAFKDYLTMIHQWYSEGLISQDYINHSDIQISAGDVTDGSTGLWYHMSQIMSEHVNSAIDPNFDSVAICDAVNEKGDKTRIGGYSDNTVDVTNCCISATCEDIETVAKWLDFAYTDQGSLIFSFGVEGTTFEYDDNGEPVFTDLIINNPDGLGSIVACNMYAIQVSVGYIYETRFMSSYTPAALAAGDIWMTTLDTDHMISIPSAATLGTEEATTFAQYYSNILTYAAENIAKFITGARSLDEFDDYVADIESMGIDKCVACWQSAVDAVH